MASNLQKPPKDVAKVGAPVSDSNGGESGDHLDHSMMISLGSDEHHHDHYEPSPVKTENSDAMIETRCLMKDTGKKTAMKKEMGSEGEDSDLDLKLELPQPGHGLANKKDESFNESVSSSSISMHSCTSMEDNPGGDTSKTYNFELPSLVLMGCERCYMYIMVSEADPKCPNCKSTFLLDVFRDRPAKKTRKSY